MLLRHDEDELVDIVEEMVDLPSTDISLQLPLPRVLPPELEVVGIAEQHRGQFAVGARHDAGVDGRGRSQLRGSEIEGGEPDPHCRRRRLPVAAGDAGGRSFT